MIEKILERIAYWIKVCEIEINKAEAELDVEEIEFYKGQLMAYEKTKEIVQEVAKEYGNASDTDLAVVSAIPSLYPLQPYEEEAIHKVVASAKDGSWIPCSGCSDCQHKECEHYGKV